jgi:hypothetical protein
VFEEISDPSRRWPPQGKDALPIDSDEASRAARLSLGFVFVLVAFDVWSEYRTPDVYFLRDAMFLTLVALAWLLRSTVAAGLASLLAPLFVFQKYPPSTFGLGGYGKSRHVLVLFGMCVYAAWACHRFHAFRKEESRPADSPDELRPG